MCTVKHSLSFFLASFYYRLKILTVVVVLRRVSFLLSTFGLQLVVVQHSAKHSLDLPGYRMMMSIARVAGCYVVVADNIGVGIVHTVLSERR
jgi:hypothetical protein